jgi:hypothetical protein
VGYFDGGISCRALEKRIPFGSAQGRLSRQKKGARNDKVKKGARSDKVKKDGRNDRVKVVDYQNVSEV